MDAAFLQSLLPAEAGVRITAMTVGPTAVVVAFITTGDRAAGSRYGSISETIHGHYRRTVRDRPYLGLPVAIAFVCCRTDCPRRVFCERVPDLTAPLARTTGEMADAHRRAGTRHRHRLTARSRR